MSPGRTLMKMARPGRVELPTLCLEAARVTLPNLARGVANRANSASWNKLPQTIFSFIWRHLLHIAAVFRDLRDILVTVATVIQSTRQAI
jgi:hypothetical protein